MLTTEQFLLEVSMQFLLLYKKKEKGNLPSSSVCATTSGDIGPDPLPLKA